MDPRARYLCNAPGFGEKPYPRTCAAAGKHDRYVWEGEHNRPRALSDSVLYKLQVRSFTMHKSSGVRKKGEPFRPGAENSHISGNWESRRSLLMPAYEYRERAAAEQAARPAVFLYRGKKKRMKNPG